MCVRFCFTVILSTKKNKKKLRGLVKTSKSEQQRENQGVAYNLVKELRETDLAAILITRTVRSSGRLGTTNVVPYLPQFT